MKFLSAFFSNHILIPAISAWGVAQLIKIITTLIHEKRFAVERIFGDGGMPSGHAATVSALAFMSAYLYGFASFEFAICAVFAIIVMHDATGVRRETGKQTATILQLFAAVNGILNEKDKIKQTEKLKLLVGHSHVQVFCGLLLGFAVSILYIVIFGIDTDIVISFRP